MPAPHWFFRFMYDCESAAWERRRDEPEQRELVRRIADELANVVAPPGPVADLGCGPGAHALALARRGYEVVGVDGSPRMVQVARTRAAHDQVDVTFDVHDVSAPLRFADASLGGVLAILVVQHLPHPAAFITEIRRCLRPGGILVLNLPAYAWLWSAHDAAVDNERRFGRAELEHLLAAAGFAAVRAFYWNSFLFPLMVLRRKVWRHAGSDVGLLPAPVERLFALIMALESRLRRAGLALPFGGSILALAVKPS